MFNSEFLDGEHVIISDRLVGLPLLMAVFAFYKAKIFNGETPTPSASSSLPSGGDLFLRVFADVLPSAIFPMDTGICNSLSVLPVASSFQFPWHRFPNSDLRKTSSKNRSGLIG
jgi:hypothetical protein